MENTTKESVLLTGISGSLGQLIALELKKHAHIIGVDRRPLPIKAKNIEHHQLDLRRKSAFSLLKKKAPTSIVHIGVLRNPLKHRETDAYYFNLDITTQILKLAEQLHVKKFVFLSTANLYGPSSRTSGFLEEDAPLHGANRSPEIRDLVALDMMIQSFFWKQPNIETVILRPVHIVGQNLQNAPSKYLRLSHSPTILGYDPMLQLVHESDVVKAIALSLKPGARGVFNIVGSGAAPLSRILNARGSVAVPVLESGLRKFLSVMYRCNLSHFPPGEVDHLKYTCLVDGTRAEKELGYKPKYTLDKTVAALMY